MNQIGLYALFSVLIFRYFLNPDERFFKNFILGLFIPSLIDSFCSIIFFFFNPPLYLSDSHNLFFSHSIFIGLLVILLFYAFSEIKKNRYYRVIGNAFFLGFLTHIICDMLFWIDPLYLFWPIRDTDLEVNFISLLFNLNLKNYTLWVMIKLFLEFLFLQFYAKLLIDILITKELNGRSIQILSFYQKTQLNLFFLFLVLFFVFYYMNIDKLNLLFIFFNLLYFPSLLMAVFATYKAKINLSK